jgi:hypothetical protein
VNGPSEQQFPWLSTGPLQHVPLMHAEFGQQAPPHRGALQHTAPVGAPTGPVSLQLPALQQFPPQANWPVGQHVVLGVPGAHDCPGEQQSPAHAASPDGHAHTPSGQPQPPWNVNPIASAHQIVPGIVALALVPEPSCAVTTTVTTSASWTCEQAGTTRLSVFVLLPRFTLPSGCTVPPEPVTGPFLPGMPKNSVVTWALGGKPVPLMQTTGPSDNLSAATRMPAVDGPEVGFAVPCGGGFGPPASA